MKGLTVSGSWLFCGAQMSQNELALPMFRILLGNIAEPLRIVELGTYQGALTWFIYQVAPEGTGIHTFDNRNRVPESLRYQLIKAGVLLHPLDVFEQGGTEFVKGLLNVPHRRVVLLCDNGDKVREVNTFAPFLKKGDIVMCHDYAESEEAAKELYGTYWNHCEIRYDQIERTLLDGGFVPYRKDLTLHAAWGCFIRE